MKLIKLLPLVAIAGACLVGQVDAAKDELMMPEPDARPFTVNQVETSIVVPSEEVRETVAEFTAFQLAQHNKIIQDDNRIMIGQQRYRNNVLYYMNVRRSWYIVSHRYKEDSYARVALDRLYNDYKKFFESHTTVSEAGRMEYAQEIIDILDRNTAGIKNDELRFYMNEMVIFSLKQSMKDGNNRVKVVQQTNELAAEGDRVVNLRKAINTEEALD